MKNNSYTEQIRIKRNSAAQNCTFKRRNCINLVQLYLNVTRLISVRRMRSKDMSIPPERERTSGRMIAANSLGWILTRDFWAGGSVNSILTLVLFPPDRNYPLRPLHISWLEEPEVWRLGPIYNSPSFSTNIDWREWLWRTYLGSLGYAPFICSLSSSRISYSKMILKK